MGRFLSIVKVDGYYDPILAFAKPYNCRHRRIYASDITYGMFYDNVEEPQIIYTNQDLRI